MSTAIDWRLSRDAFGRLILEDAEGRRHEGVVPVRAFPLTDPDLGLAILDSAGQELVWVEDIKALPEASRVMIEAELTGRDFMPEILCIKAVSSFTTPSHWQIATDRGETSLTLRGEEYIRHLGSGALLIADEQGIHFLIRDLQALDRHSRRLLDRFL